MDIPTEPQSQSDEREEHHARRVPRWAAAAMAAAMLAAGFGGYAGIRASESSPSRATTSTRKSITLSVDQVTAKVDTAVVDVTSTLVGGGTAKGTGLVIASDGVVLTNNHVIDGASKITVQLVTTGRTYNATLVGYSTSADVAVLRLSNATGLSTISTADSASTTTGESVVVIGNAGGRDGTPTAVAGMVTAVGQTITASDGSGANAETLRGLVEIAADIEAGDSGARSPTRAGVSLP